MELIEVIVEVIAGFLGDFDGLDAFILHFIEDLDEVFAGCFEGGENGAAVAEVVCQRLLGTGRVG